MRKPVIAIDGPAGSGKSTTARLVADKLGLFYLDTGAMYRAIALKVVRLGMDPNSEQRITDLAVRTGLEFKIIDGKQHVIMDGRDVSSEIRTPDVTAAASAISVFPEVRKVLVALQREVGRDGGVVAEGRDTASVVFPNADLKIYLVASPEVRAERRFKDMQELGIDTTMEEQIERLKERDEADSTRDFSPLTKVDDAIELDTSSCTIDEQVQKVIDLAKKAAAD